MGLLPTSTPNNNNNNDNNKQLPNSQQASVSQEKSVGL
jgi:hypothetical protein